MYQAMKDVNWGDSSDKKSMSPANSREKTLKQVLPPLSLVVTMPQ